jgi:hypothetical protein
LIRTFGGHVEITFSELNAGAYSANRMPRTCLSCLARHRQRERVVVPTHDLCRALPFRRTEPRTESRSPMEHRLVGPCADLYGADPGFGSA